MEIPITLSFILISLACGSSAFIDNSGEKVECISHYKFLMLPYLDPGPKSQQLTIARPQTILTLVPDLKRKFQSHFLSDFNEAPNKDFDNFGTRYTGYVDSDVNSKASGIIDEAGRFYGAFTLNGVAYFVQPSISSQITEQFYNAIIFKTSDIVQCEMKNGRLRKVPIDSFDPEPCRWSLQQLHGEMSRVKRIVDDDQNSLICDLQIVIDRYFYENVAKSNREKAMTSVVNLMKKVDALFRKIDFDGDGKAENLGFFVSSMMLYLNGSEQEVSELPTEWNPVRYFNELQQYDFNGSCAGLLFTYQKMQSPEIYGPSNFKSTVNSTDYGICSNSSQIPTGILDDYGAYIGNSVPVNFMQYGKVFREPNHLVIQMAHQLAQLFGAPLDTDTQCKTDDPEKMNIMAYPIPSGAYKENFKFSKCSIDAMSKYLTGMTKPCVRICKGPSCTVKRSLNNPLSYFEFKYVTKRSKNSTDFPNSHAEGIHVSTAIQVEIVLILILSIIFA